MYPKTTQWQVTWWLISRLSLTPSLSYVTLPAYLSIKLVNYSARRSTCPYLGPEPYYCIHLKPHGCSSLSLPEVAGKGRQKSFSILSLPGPLHPWTWSTGICELLIFQITLSLSMLCWCLCSKHSEKPKPVTLAQCSLRSRPPHQQTYSATGSSRT